MTLAYNIVYLAVFALQGASGNPLDAFLSIAVPACFLNVIVLLPVYFVLTAASQDLRRSVYA
jgi:hypothetical protein